MRLCKYICLITKTLICRLPKPILYHYNMLFLKTATKFSLSVLFFSFCFLTSTKGQINYNYDQLSSNFYQVKKDSLKASFKCPDQFSKKETQKKFKDIWDGRTAFLFESIANNQFLVQPEMYKYVYELLQEIISGNKKFFTQAPFLLIDRNSSVNAYALGNNILAVNIGLLAFVETREELALVLAHELAHNSLRHPENSMIEKADLLTSEKYKNELEEISKSTYGKYSRLTKILEGYSFSRAKHNRYHEEEADSMAHVLLANSKMSYDPKIFLRLDSADFIYKKELKNNISDYFSKAGIQLDENWLKKAGRGLSTKKYNFKDLTLADSLKTHPDCIDRYKYLAAKLPANEKPKATPIPASIVNSANDCIVWWNIINNNLTAAMYRILLEKDKGNNLLFNESMTSVILNRLFNADKKFERFNAVNVEKKELISAKYFELQTLFEQVPREKLEIICDAELNKPFWQQTKADTQYLKSIFKNINFLYPVSPKDLKSLKTEFQKSYPNSPVRELVERIL